ncbi:hypothetical protein D3Z51_13020 [Clostridiaceae bacterium]|nr:hypothetical protein [Clostridiaceae bacterium]RKI12060.1 hypothetical protein D7V81_12775 [bacterium 1XD21-70]
MHRVIISSDTEKTKQMNVWMRPVPDGCRPERDAQGGSILRKRSGKTSSERSLIGSGDPVIVKMRWLPKCRQADGKKVHGDAGSKRGGTAIVKRDRPLSGAVRSGQGTFFVS